MLQDAEPTPYTIGEHVVASSSKLIVIDKILGDILPKGERVLIFSVCPSPLVFFLAYSLSSIAMDKVCVTSNCSSWLLTGVPSMLDLLEDFMELRRIPYARLDGSTSRPRRNLDIRLVSATTHPPRSVNT